MNRPPTGALLSRVVRFAIVRPGLTIVVCLVLALAGVGGAARALTFQASSGLLPPRTNPRSAMLAVALNGLTTVTGFGSLMVARHQGIFGLGLLLTIGAAAALVTSLVLLPVMLSLVDRSDGKRSPRAHRKEPSCRHDPRWCCRD
jgi:predicted RND superfamily exporter protein